MRIILIRHGKPAMPTFRPVTASDFGRWIQAYNHANLCDQSLPTAELYGLAADCNLVICSHLTRSVESAKKLGKEIHRSDVIFREMELPWGNFPAIKLSPNLWSVIFRILWFFGFSKNSESCAAAKIRARTAALELATLAQESGTVLLVGHGFLNKFIARYLLKNGWRCVTRPGNDYWSYNIYELK